MSPQLATPGPRPVPSWARADLDPAQEVAALLRRHRTELAQAHAETKAAQQRAAALAEAVGLTLAKKRAAMSAQDFRPLADLLQAQSIEVVTHTFQPLTPELEETADIVEWLEEPAPGPSDRVVEAFEPEIRFEGQLVHRAKLSCAKGAEIAADDAPAGPGAASASHGDSVTEELPVSVVSPAAAAEDKASAAGEGAGTASAALEVVQPEKKGPGRFRRAWAVLMGRDQADSAQAANPEQADETTTKTEGESNEDQ